MASDPNKDLNFGLFSVSSKVGPVNTVLDKVFRKQGPNQEEADVVAEANDQARRRRINETVNLPGWPFRNHAQELRRTRSLSAHMILPRRKFTYVVEFRIDEDWLKSGLMITNLRSRGFIGNGSLYIPVKAVDHPQVNFAVETLRSANRYVKVPTRMEYQPATITFDDDTTSLIAALRKEYINFYHYAGDIGQSLGVGPTPLEGASARDEYQYEAGSMTATVGDDNRSRMSVHPSIGLKMRRNCAKHFFQEIVVYDLGQHPDSVNVYFFYHPVATQWTHDNLDVEDRGGKVGIGLQFEYEGYYDLIGQNNGKVAGILNQIFGISVAPAPRTDDHATMIDPASQATDAQSTCVTVPDTGSTNSAPTVDCSELGNADEIGRAIREIGSRSGSRFTDADRARLEELNAQLGSIRDCEESQSQAGCANTDTVSAAGRTKGSAANQGGQSCADRNATASFGANGNSRLNFSDSDYVGLVCGMSGDATALQAEEQRQVKLIQLTQRRIGELNNQIGDLQFDLSQTPVTQPSRIAQLEAQIAEGQQQVSEYTDAIDVRTSMLSFVRTERGLPPNTPSSQIPGGCDGVTGTADGTSASSMSALEQRAQMEQQFQDLSQEALGAQQEVDTAINDLEIMQNIKSSATLAGSQSLSDEAKLILTQNGGDVLDAINQRRTQKEAAEKNVETINAELVPLGRALNRG